MHCELLDEIKNNLLLMIQIYRGMMLLFECYSAACLHSLSLHDDLFAKERANEIRCRIVCHLQLLTDIAFCEKKNCEKLFTIVRNFKLFLSLQ